MRHAFFPSNSFLQVLSPLYGSEAWYNGASKFLFHLHGSFQSPTRKLRYDIVLFCEARITLLLRIYSWNHYILSVRSQWSLIRMRLRRAIHPLIYALPTYGSGVIPGLSSVVPDMAKARIDDVPLLIFFPTLLNSKRLRYRFPRKPTGVAHALH